MHPIHRALEARKVTAVSCRSIPGPETHAHVPVGAARAADHAQRRLHALRELKLAQSQPRKQEAAGKRRRVTPVPFPPSTKRSIHRDAALVREELLVHDDLANVSVEVASV